MTKVYEDIEIHTLMTREFGEKYLNQFYNPESALPLAKAFIELGYPTNHIAAFIRYRLNRFGGKKIGDNPNAFYKLPIRHSQPPINITMLEDRSYRSLFLQLRDISPPHSIKVVYTGSITE